MNSFISRVKYFSLAAVLLVGAFGCSAGGDTGQLSLSLTDKPSDDYDAVYVTIARIDVHKAEDLDGEWMTVATPAKTYDLLALAGGVREQLGLVSLEAGHYSQLRLIIGDTHDGGVNILGHTHPAANYVVDTDGFEHEMKIPSGYQTGIKLVQSFDINENSTTELTFDFDAARSVVRAGNSGKYLLKPTVQVIDMGLAAVIGGTVTTMEEETPVGVGGALVSIQVYDSTAADAKDQIAVKASTFTDDTDLHRGDYKFFFAVDPAGETFNIVAGQDGLVSDAARLFIENGTAYTQDFELDAVTESGTVNVTITGATADVPVTLSFRQTVTLGADEVMIEVMSVGVVNGDPDPLTLPVGDYTLVAWTEGKTTYQTPVSVTSGGTSDVAVTF